MTPRRAFLAVLALALTAFVVAPAKAETVVHGADQRFTAPTVALAWAILRGATEEKTAVVIRIVNTAGMYRHVRVEGSDPFTKARAVLVEGQPIAGRIDVQIPRARFADFPSTEVQLFAATPTSGTQPATLTVFYLGVPDTTPEFTTGPAVDAYFAQAFGAH